MAELVETKGGELAVVSVVVVGAAAAVARLEGDAGAAVEAGVRAAGVEGELAAVALVARSAEAEEVIAVSVLLASSAAEAGVRGTDVALLLLAPLSAPVAENKDSEFSTVFDSFITLRIEILIMSIDANYQCIYKPERRAKALEAVPGRILDALTVKETGTGVARVLLNLAELSRELCAAVAPDPLPERGRVEHCVLVL